LGEDTKRYRLCGGIFPGQYIKYWLALFTHLGEALAAVNRAVGLGLEGNLSFLTASSTSGREELSGATSSLLSAVTACLAALGLVLEAALCVEFLLTSREHELVAALFAYQSLVVVHGFYLSFSAMR
jgi:hypothetical protein